MTKKLKGKINALAGLFYRSHGYITEPGYDFSRASHPQEKGMWNLATMSHDFWTQKFEDPDVKNRLLKKLSNFSGERIDQSNAFKKIKFTEEERQLLAEVGCV